MILVDSNVIVAGLVDDHPHHADSVTFMSAEHVSPLIVAAHSHAEVFSTLTRLGGPRRYGFDAALVVRTLAVATRPTTAVAMTAEQTVDAVRQFADIGVGARLYDYLIGRTGIVHGARAIVTFNTGHMRALFPAIAVHTPGEWMTLNPVPTPPP